MPLFTCCTPVDYEDPSPLLSPLPPAAPRKDSSPALFPRSSAFPPSNQPLELLAEANEAIRSDSALLACRLLEDLCFQDAQPGWVQDNVALCLAKAYLLLGNELPIGQSAFPPVDSFFVGVREEQVAVAVVKRRKERDGLESLPITFYRGNYAAVYSKDFHAEVAMLAQQVKAGDQALERVYHLQDVKRSHRQGAAGKTWFWKKLTQDVVVVVHFPKSLREPNDAVVLALLDRLSRLFFVRSM